MDVLALPIFVYIAALLVLITICLSITLLCLQHKKSGSTAVVPLPDNDNPTLRSLKENVREFMVAYNELKFGKLIGKGSQGEVFLATWRGSTVAVKRIDTRQVDHVAIDEFCQEANIMRRLRHPSLTLFLGVSIEEPELCILTEFVQRGSLFDILQDDHSPYTWQRGLRILTDVARGMTYLHAHRPHPILHRDLKSLNILVDEQWRGKVADFGMTRFHEDGVTMTQCGSPLWMAPEMIRNMNYDEKSDTYSFGICLWEIYTRKIPYRSLGLTPSALVTKVVRDHLRPEIPSCIPKPYYRLLERCWHPNPDKRPSFSQILRVLESFIEDPMILGHVPFSTRTNAPAAEVPAKNLRARKRKEKDALAGGWLIERPKRDVTVDTVPCGARMQHVHALAERAVNKTSEVDHNPYRYLGEPVLDSVAAGSVALTVQPLVRRPTNHNQSSASGGGELTGILPDGESAPSVRMDAEFPSDVHFALYKGQRVCVRKVFLTALATDPDPLKGSSLPPWAWQLQGSQAPSKYISSLKVSQDKATHARVLKYLQQAASARHPSLLLYLGGYVCTDHVGIVTEHMAQGTLSKLLRSNVLFEWDVTLTMLLDVARGLLALHSLPEPVYPEHFSPALVLVDEHWRCKLSTTHLSPSLDKLICGLTPGGPAPASPYTAPELIEGGAAAAPTVGSNMYALGMLVHQVFSREPAYGGTFDARTCRNVVKKGLRPSMPSSMPDKLAQLVHKCWAANPHERPQVGSVIACLEEQQKAGPPRIELRLGDPGVLCYNKRATIFAYRTADPITVLKDWGRNQGGPGSYVVCSPDDDVYMVDADIFHNTYMPTKARPHEYRKLGRVLARCMPTAFAVSVRGSIEQGHAGDYLVQTEQGDQWVVEGQVFNGLYATDSTANAAAVTASGKAMLTPGDIAVTIGRSISRASEPGTTSPRAQRVRATAPSNKSRPIATSVPMATASPPPIEPPTPVARKLAPAQAQRAPRASTAAAGLASMRGGNGLVSIRAGGVPSSLSLFEVQRQMVNK